MSWGRTGLVSIMFLLFLGICPAWGEVVVPELQGALLGAAAEDVFSVIVTFDSDEAVATLASEAGRRDRGEVVRALRSRSENAQGPVRALLHGRGKSFQDLWIINGLALDATPELIELLSERPEVVEIRVNGVLQLPEPQLAQAHTGFWNLEAVRAPELWGQGLDGQGVTVAVLDSGVDIGHPDLAPRWRGGSNSWFNPYAAGCTANTCTPCEASATQPCDDASGHGTAVAGVIVGGDAGGTPIGVAPGARWIAAKVFRDNGTATFAAIHSAFQWVLANDEPPHVVNNSWGLGPAGTCVQEFRASVQALRAAGIAVVFAAGNNGPNASTSLSPANYPEGVAAGAVNRNLQLAPFSGRGPGTCDGMLYPELTAPGVEVLTADSSAPGAPRYVFASGTSFSAPHVTGTLALLRQAFPAASAQELERAVIDSAADLGTFGPDNGFGAGLVDAVAALRRLQGEPHLGVYDFFPPASDRSFTFGAVSPGQILRQDFFFYNAGGGALRIESSILAGATPQAFTVSGNECLGIDLPPGQSCRITLDFIPPSNALFDTELVLQNNTLQGAVTVDLSGEGTDTPFPPILRLIPVNAQVSFGSVPPGSVAQREVVIFNGGQGMLTVAPSALPAPPFSVFQNSCLQPPQGIPAGQECTITLRFAPLSLNGFTGSLEIESNDPQRRFLPISLGGIGNTPPLPAQLLFPVSGAAVGPTVTFRWLSSPDPDGHPVTDILVVSRSIEFPDNLVAAGPSAAEKALLAGAGSLLFALGGALLVRRTHRWTGAFFIALALLAMGACGGGGGNVGVESSQIVSGLTPGETYFWKVVSEDALGGVASSDIRTFSVQ